MARTTPIIGRYESGGILQRTSRTVGDCGTRESPRRRAIQYGNKETEQRTDIVLNVAAESAGKVEPVNTGASAASTHRDSDNKRNLRRIESEAAAPDREGHTQEQILLHNDEN